MRHRVALRDFSMLTALMLVALFLVYEYDVYRNEHAAMAQQRFTELDEVLTLGALLAVGLLVIALRRYFEQGREMRRRIAAERHAREIALQDALTGLPNRRRFDQALKAALAAPPAPGWVHAVFMLDLNGFKQVNDVHGHGIGDEVLIVVAQRLLESVREGDLVARFGGDEFAILARNLMGAEAATNIAARVMHSLERPVATGELQHRVGTAIGISLLPLDAATGDEALRKADVALYRAKSERRTAMCYFETEMDRQLLERDQLARAFRAALAAGEIAPLFVPCEDLQTGRVVGFESVPRWVDPVHGEIEPARFVPIAEDSGLVHELADHLLRLSCAAAARWPAHVSLAIDLFPSQLRDRGLAPRIVAILAEHGLAPGRLEMQISESTLIADMDAGRELLAALREAGVMVALDHVGTGYSSLYHLCQLKLDKIKIDGSFVRSMVSERESAAIVSALVGLGRQLGVTVAADGVEDPGIRGSLMRAGCEQGQGGALSRAVPADATRALV